MPHFTKDTGIDIKWTATGTGKALKLGTKCDVDVLLVHAPPAEKKYIADGYGKDRTQIMYNDFVIIGPASDPAGLKGKTLWMPWIAFGWKKPPLPAVATIPGPTRRKTAVEKHRQSPS